MEIVYAPTDDSPKNVKDSFEDELMNLLEVLYIDLIIDREFNGRVYQEQNIAVFGRNVRNKNGIILLNLWQQCEL